MKLTPIPKQLLTESVTVRVPVPDDYGLAWGEPQRLDHVRVETAESLALKGFALTDGTKAMLYIDGIHSTGCKSFPPTSLVEWQGQELAAASVTPYGIGGVIHHWEVTLK